MNGPIFSEIGEGIAPFIVVEIYLIISLKLSLQVIFWASLN